ncbi:MAG: GntR family transcriptional regulator [Nocardioides sp.]|uniref:FadR/GntR family transcriptional regulator n=1 Tax=Nocardioides sp. TaxID=35761 RepID=UPI0039E2F89C
MSGTQRARVADELLTAIRSGRYAAGERLPGERGLAESYGVSRPVVREALGMLASLGLVDIQMGRGAFVTSLDVAEQSRGAQRSLSDLSAMREVLETGALATGRRHGVSPAAGERVRSALAELERAVRSGAATVDADRAFHRSVIAASGSTSAVRTWEELTAQLESVVEIRPASEPMGSRTLGLHRQLAGGVLGDDLDAALAACHELHQDYREFLQRLLG